MSSLAAVSIWYKRWLDLWLIQFGTKGGSARVYICGWYKMAVLKDIRIYALNFKVGGDKGAIVKVCGYVVGMYILKGDSLPICDELRHSVNSADWEPQFIYYYERSMLDDIRLARQINALCDTLTNVIDKRWAFNGELELLAYKFVPRKMEVFIKEIHDKDIPNLMKL
nr:hypothetical protein [Tanacetum cinerariifolium]